jgi:hypothetical protein
LDFSPGDGDAVVEDFALFEVGVGAEKFKVVCAGGFFEAAAVFDDLF